jgi:signal transduction histidine kinase
VGTERPVANPALPAVLLLRGRARTLDAAARTLEQTGYAVTPVTDAAEALQQLRAGRFGLVLAEADLRDDAGRVLLAELRLQWPDTVGVLVTDYRSLEAAIDLLSEGAYDYVVRPCPPTVLTATIARAMERGALARALRQGVQELDDAKARLEALSADLQRRVDEATAALRRKVAELEEEQGKREALIAMIAHDLGNPLTALAGYAQLLGRPGLTSQQQERARATLVSEIGQLTRLVGDLVDRSALRDSWFRTTHEECDLLDLLRQQVELAQLVAPGREIALEAPDDALRVTCDRQRLAQVVSNLLHNALKYAPTGPIRLSVRVERDDVLISVTDHGPGIPPGQAEAIFEPGIRLGAADRWGIPGGHGLGLHIARGIVEAHGGRIWVETSPGGGATFRFNLPRRSDHLGSRRDRG